MNENDFFDNHLEQIKYFLGNDHIKRLSEVSNDKLKIITNILRDDHMKKLSNLANYLKSKDSELRDGVPFRTVLSKILNENNNNVSNAQSIALIMLNSGELQKIIQKTANEQKAHRDAKKAYKT